MTSKVTSKAANHPVGRLLGVKQGDSKVEAAQKAIDAMELAGFSTRKAKKMLADYRKRTGE